MNRTSRHELAERALRGRLEREGQFVVSASTTSPCDLISFSPNGGRLAPTFWEVKTARGRRTSDLYSEERALGRRAERAGSPYVLARFEVRGTRVVSGPDLYRPFAKAESPAAEIVVEAVP